MKNYNVSTLLAQTDQQIDQPNNPLTLEGIEVPSWSLKIMNLCSRWWSKKKENVAENEDIIEKDEL